MTTSKVHAQSHRGELYFILRPGDVVDLAQVVGTDDDGRDVRVGDLFPPDYFEDAATAPAADEENA